MRHFAATLPQQGRMSVKSKIVEERLDHERDKLMLRAIGNKHKPQVMLADLVMDWLLHKTNCGGDVPAIA